MPASTEMYPITAWLPTSDLRRSLGVYESAKDIAVSWHGFCVRIFRVKSPAGDGDLANSHRLRSLRKPVQRREVSTLSIQTESHLIAALIAAGWWVNGQRMWVHECISGEYTLLEAVRILR